LFLKREVVSEGEHVAAPLLPPYALGDVSTPLILVLLTPSALSLIKFHSLVPVLHAFLAAVKLRSALFPLRPALLAVSILTVTAHSVSDQHQDNVMAGDSVVQEYLLLLRISVMADVSRARVSPS